jgi:hypothetical protein
VLARLWRPRHTGKIAHARELAELIAARYPDRTVHVVADAAYVGERFRDVDDRITWTSRLKVTSVLHELSPPRTGRSGRPRTRGARVGTPADVASLATTANTWRTNGPSNDVAARSRHARTLEATSPSGEFPIRVVPNASTPSSNSITSAALPSVPRHGISPTGPSPWRPNDSLCAESTSSATENGRRHQLPAPSAPRGRAHVVEKKAKHETVPAEAFESASTA